MLVGGLRVYELNKESHVRPAWIGEGAFAAVGINPFRGLVATELAQSCHQVAEDASAKVDLVNSLVLFAQRILGHDPRYPQNPEFSVGQIGKQVIDKVEDDMVARLE